MIGIVSTMEGLPYDMVEVGLIQKEQLRLEASSRATGVLIMLFFKIDLRAQVKLDAGDDGMTDLSKLTSCFIRMTSMMD